MHLSARVHGLLFLFLIIGFSCTAPLVYAQYVPDLTEANDVIESISTDNPSFSEQYQDIERQGLIFAGICEGPTTDCDCRDEGRCTLDDILQVIVNLTVFILGIIGSIILVLLIYGGFLWMTAAGDMGRVKKGIDVMRDAVIGLLIVFASYALITTLIGVLKQGRVPSGGNLEDVIGGNASDVIQTSE